MTNITGAILYMYYCSVQVTRLPPCSGSGSIGSDSSVLQIYVSPLFWRHLLVSWEGGGSWDDRILHLGPLSLHPLQLYQPLPGHSGPARVRIKLRQLRMRTEEQISGSFPRCLRHQSHHLYNCLLFPDSGGRCRTLEIKLFPAVLVGVEIEIFGAFQWHLIKKQNICIYTNIYFNIFRLQIHFGGCGFEFKIVDRTLQKIAKNPGKTFYKYIFLLSAFTCTSMQNTVTQFLQNKI